MPTNARKKGNNYELEVIKLFRELGWNCVSSRSESKRTDDAGIDVCYSDPFQIQAKAWERAPSYHEVLKGMPEKKGMFNLLFHKRNRKGTVVAMPWEHFREILEMLISNQIIKPTK
jgi:hypothetical protein